MTERSKVQELVLSHNGQNTKTKKHGIRDVTPTYRRWCFGAKLGTGVCSVSRTASLLTNLTIIAPAIQHAPGSDNSDGHAARRTGSGARLSDSSKVEPARGRPLRTGSPDRAPRATAFVRELRRPVSGRLAHECGVSLWPGQLVTGRPKGGRSAPGATEGTAAHTRTVCVKGQGCIEQVREVCVSSGRASQSARATWPIIRRCGGASRIYRQHRAVSQEASHRHLVRSLPRPCTCRGSRRKHVNVRIVEWASWSLRNGNRITQTPLSGYNILALLFSHGHAQQPTTVSHDVFLS